MNTKENAVRPEKQSIVDEFQTKFTGSSYLFLTDCGHLNTEKTADLRDRLRAMESEFHVVKNRLFRLSVADDLGEALDDVLKGPTGMVTGTGDPAAVAKVLKKFYKDNELVAVKAGALDGQVLTAADVMELADLPGLDQMRGILAGTLAAPMTQLVGVFQQKLSSVVYALKAYQEKQENQG